MFDGVTVRFFAFTAITWYILNLTHKEEKKLSIRASYLQRDMDDAIRHGVLTSD
jgi:hypothetical protein